MGIDNIQMQMLSGYIDDSTIVKQKEEEKKDVLFRKNANMRFYLIVMSLLRVIDILSFIKKRIDYTKTNSSFRLILDLIVFGHSIITLIICFLSFKK